MKLYFLRHGQADWASWKKPDDERPLTKRGKREMRDVAKFLDRLKVRPDLIVTSPLPRAAQTAEIAADYLKAKVRKDESLAPGFGRSKLRTVVKRHRANVLMLVGHEPDFTNVISGLTGASLKLSKAGVALVDVDPESEKAKLLWLQSNWQRPIRTLVPTAGCLHYCLAFSATPSQMHAPTRQIERSDPPSLVVSLRLPFWS